MDRWIIAICPMCGQVTYITKLLLSTDTETNFTLSRLMEWVRAGLTIEIRKEGHFPVSLNPCNCVRDPQADQIDASVLSLLDEAGVMNTDLLDDTVHDVASRIASGVNNRSSSAQVRFITQEAGDSGVINIVQEVLAFLGGKKEVEEEL